MSTPTPTKRCIMCGEYKPLDDFYMRSPRKGLKTADRQASNPSDRRSFCKSCWKTKYMPEWRKRHPTYRHEQYVKLGR